MARAPNLDQYLASSTHPNIASVAQFCADLALRLPDARAHIKWNAPSFYMLGGVDVVTFRLNPAPICQIVLHLGARVVERTAPQKLDFPAPPDVLRWLAPDRAVMDFVQTSYDTALDIAVRWLNAYARR
jgi:hypothetical protein